MWSAVVNIFNFLSHHKVVAGSMSLAAGLTFYAAATTYSDKGDEKTKAELSDRIRNNQEAILWRLDVMYLDQNRQETRHERDMRELREAIIYYHHGDDKTK